MIIVNFSTELYKPGQKRLSESLNGHKQLMLNSYASIGSPTHQESPYEFKIHAIEAAFEVDPIVLYCDASFWAVGDLGKIEKTIKEDGYLLCEAGAWVGDWTNEFTRNYFKLTKAEASVPGGLFMFSAGFVGLNKDSDMAMEFFRQWKESGKAGCFRGSHTNHRHDQSAGSIIAQRLGMKYQPGGKVISYVGPGYAEPDPEASFYLQGMV